ncbi:MAG: SDR family oxidoreductase [Cloacibacillus sp.]
MNYNKMFDFSGKGVLITGGLGTMGQEFARAFASCGGHVVVADKNGAASENLQKECEAYGVKYKFLEVDLSVMDGIDSLVNDSIAFLGKIDVFCNHAGINIRKPVVEYTEAEYDAVMNINAKSSYFMCQAVGRHMIAHKGGSIINTCSDSYERAHMNLSVYAASKASMQAYMRVCAREWAQYGVNINAVAPGYVITGLTETLVSAPGNYEKFLERIPMHRYCATADVASAIMFLASPGAQYITGQTLFIDGGRMFG